MPGRRLVDGRIVENDHPRGISWRRAVALSLVLFFLLLSNPANEATTARFLERLRIDNLVAKWTGRRLSTMGNSYWNRRSTNYGIATLKERVTGSIEIGVAGQSWVVCSLEDPDEWGLLCRKLKSVASHPGIEWWRLPSDQPPVVLHRVLMLLLAATCGAVACHVHVPQDPLITMFVPSSHQNPFVWLMQVWIDTNVLLFPVWERMYQVTTLQATSSPCRIAGSNDDLNFYAAVVVVIITAAGVRLLTGHGQSQGWFIFVVTVMGYWRGTQYQQQQQSTIFEDPTQAESDLVLCLSFRLLWFVLTNGLVNVGAILVTIVAALFAGAALGDYHYNQQVWQVWSQSWSKMVDDTLTQLFGRTPNYRAY